MTDQKNPTPSRAPNPRLIRRLARRAWELAAAGFVPLVVAAASSAGAQEITVNPENPVFQDEVFEPATQYHPERVRNILRAIHGFTQEALESTSTDIPEILMGFIDDPNEGNLVQRQAIKALRLYPAEETLGFIEGRVDAAPRGLQILYVLTLGGFAEGAPARVSTVMENMLEHADRGIRSAALSLSRTLRTPRATLALKNRLAREPDPNLRRAIQLQLSVR